MAWPFGGHKIWDVAGCPGPGGGYSTHVTPYAATIGEIPDALRAEMRGRSWRDEPDCPRFEELRLLGLSHLGFDGAVRRGELVVHRGVAEEVAHIFEQLFLAGFPIEHMQRVDRYGGDDEASMAANNSSGFNVRRIQGSALLSHHALGLAIDINPVQNPWVRGARVDPPAGRAYLDRTRLRPGMIVAEGAVVAAFRARGWHWGGEFADAQDYHHFSKLPR
jgi:poly-gamma-glutamate synthesis protein (capsule biosynthesis protein)